MFEPKMTDKEIRIQKLRDAVNLRRKNFEDQLVLARKSYAEYMGAVEALRQVEKPQPPTQSG